jgi:tripartite-type tricarboxylate transporter receptor subunit TctC
MFRSAQYSRWSALTRSFAYAVSHATPPDDRMHARQLYAEDGNDLTPAKLRTAKVRRGGMFGLYSQGLAHKRGWLREAGIALTLTVMAIGSETVIAGAFPTKPVRLIVPFAAGGGGDGSARPLAQALSVRLGQQVIIDNRGGAGGVVGMEIVATAAPDGYTLLLSTAGFAAMPALHKSLPFDPVRDFTGVIVAESGIYILVVNVSVPLKSVKELINYAKANPGKLDFASAGIGSTIHLAGELFKSMAQVNMIHVPYKGAGLALTDVIGGQVQTMFASALNALPLIRAGKVRALAVSSARRSTLAPDLPTIAESGVPGFAVVGWYGLAVPTRTPSAIVQRLNTDTNNALKSRELTALLQAQGLEAVGGTPDDATALIRNDVARWIKVARDADIVRE